MVYMEGTGHLKPFFSRTRAKIKARPHKKVNITCYIKIITCLRTSQKLSIACKKCHVN